MDTFRSLIGAYGVGDFASDIGVPVNTARQMRKRDSVAPEYWDAWVRGSKARGRPVDVTYEQLAKIAASRRFAHASNCADVTDSLLLKVASAHA